MTLFRRRLLAALFFGLLSLGQAYPYSVAWASAGSKHACCCAEMKEGQAGCRCQHGGKTKMKCHKDTTAGYAPAPCGTPTDVRSLNFSGEPCLPRFASLTISLLFSDLTHRETTAPLPYTPVPEPPPPRA